MSDIVVKNCPCSFKYNLVVKTNFDDSGFEKLCFAEFSATCTFTVGEGAALSTFISGLSEDEIRKNEPFEMTVMLYSNGVNEAVLDCSQEKTFTKENIALELADLAKMAAEKSNARYEDQYQSRISDIRFSSVTFYESDETTVVYKWEASDDGQWTCAYCGSTVSGKFCCNCGAPRS